MENFRAQTTKLLQCEASSEALLNSVKLKTFKKDKRYCFETDKRPQWCYVLDGLVGAYQHPEGRPKYMHWATLPGQCFTGTKHEFSDSSQELDIKFLKNTRLAMIQLPQLQKLMNTHPPIMRLINILRQRRYTISDIKVKIMAQTPVDRYPAATDHLPSIPATLNNNQLAEYLNIDLKTLYRSRRKYLGR